MRSQWKRLLWAALLSCSGFAATFGWYNLTKNAHSNNENEKPLAFVGKAVEEIQRRPATRQLWQEVETGDPLYNGEAIRTSHKGEVRIQFANSNRYLDLEPESLIVIQQSKGEIALELMEGNLYVAPAKAGEETETTSLVLNSANGKVDLTNASASLSKTAGKQLEVQVLEGSASIKDKSGKEKSFTSADSSLLASANGFKKSDLKILSPVSGKTAFVDVDDKEAMTFRWNGFPKNTKVSLQAGMSRKAMKDVSTTPIASDLNALRATLPVGKPYWKLVARDVKSNQIVAESAEYRTEVQPRFAPTVVFPIADAKIPSPSGPFDMAFKWQKGDETSRVVLEIAKDPSLKQKIATKSFSVEESYTVSALKPGEYYWRMSSYYEGSEKPLMGKVQKFTVTVAEEKVVPKEPVEITWTVPEERIQFYIIEPKMNLTWDAKNTQDVAKWRLKYYEENEDPSSARVIEVQDNQSAAVVKKPGRYIASLEAVDQKGQVVATSNRKIAVAPLPLLPAPKLLPLEGNLTAAADGRTQLQWEKIEGAKEYMLTISNASGKPLKTLKYSTTQTSLKNLMPGEYQVALSTVDEHGRTSENGQLRKLIVPDKSNLKAPTLKKIKVN
jgi:hypothetical protein